MLEEQWSVISDQLSVINGLPQIHRSFDESLADVAKFKTLYLSELAEENSGINLASRSVPVTPHQFAKLAETIRQERDRNFSSLADFCPTFALCFSIARTRLSGAVYP